MTEYGLSSFNKIMQLSVIIVSWNVKDLLDKNLESIFKFTKDLDFEVIVVDNTSTDGTVPMIANKYPQVELILNNQNLGFAKANNQGLEIAKGNYILFMNPDMELVENSFKILFDYLENNKDIGIVGCTLKYGDGSVQKSVKNFPELADQLLIELKLHHIFKTKSLKHYLAEDFNYSQEQLVNQLMGAFLFCRREVVLKLKGFSQDYPIWWEDVDLCYRAKQQGIKIVYTPITSIIHHEGKSFEQQPSLFKQKRFLKGMLVFFKKYKPYYQYLILLICYPKSLFLAWLVQVLKIKPKTQSKI